ncbi:MAG: MarR family transcriptional regulator [Pseudomonadota bacterium]
MSDENVPAFFTVFNEIGIIAQLARSAFEAQLPDGMILPHFSVLNHLIRVKDGQTPRVLASTFQVPKTSLTHTLSVLEERRLIEMRPNPEDARSKCVWITQAGRQFRDEAIATIVAEFAPVEAALSPDRIERMLPDLIALRKILDAARD